MRNADTKQLFVRCAEECRTAAIQLQALVVQLGGSVEDSGTVAGAAHRGWGAVKGTLAGYTDKAILEEAERGKDTAVVRHRAAREEELPPDVRAVVDPG